MGGLGVSLFIYLFLFERKWSAAFWLYRRIGGRDLRVNTFLVIPPYRREGSSFSVLLFREDVGGSEAGDAWTGRSGRGRWVFNIFGVHACRAQHGDALSNCDIHHLL